MPRNPERELAFTTRTVEFMWAGLPVIYNDYAELSDLIGRYQAGWLVAPGNSSQLEEVVKGIAADPEAVRRASANARRLVRENLTYEKVITPLADFCRHPYRRQPSQGGDFFILPKQGRGLVDSFYVKYVKYKTCSMRELAAGLFRKAVSGSKSKILGARE
jgi:hypothetical protein